MMLSKTGGECVNWGWEEEEEEDFGDFEDQEKGEGRKEEAGEGGQREEEGEDIEKVLFDSVTTRTRGSVKETGGKEYKSEQPRRGVPREASQDNLDSSSSSSLSVLPTVVSFYLCLLCICLRF